MGTPFQSLMNCKGCISLYFYGVGYWDPRYGSHTRDKNSIRNFRKSKVENPARYEGLDGGSSKSVVNKTLDN